jgi:hypothetical protein
MQVDSIFSTAGAFAVRTSEGMVVTCGAMRLSTVYVQEENIPYFVFLVNMELLLTAIGVSL